MELIIVRHGETDWNRLEKCQGISDIPLNLNGLRQASLVAESLKSEDISSVYSSDLIRARETAEKIASIHSLPVNYDSNFREMDQGEFEGLEFKEIRKNFSSILQSWIKNPEKVRIPGGETLSEVQERAWGGFRDLYNSHQDQKVLLVSHNLTIITLLCRFSGKSLSAFREFNVKETSKSIIICDNSRYRITVFNDISHLGL